MKQVFLVIPNLEIGGAERLVIDLADHLDKSRYSISIVCLYNKSATEYSTDKLQGVEVIRMGKKKGLDIVLIFKLIKLFLLRKPDIIHTHLSCALYTAIPSIISRPKTKLHTVHSTSRKELPSSKRLFMKAMYHTLGYKAVAISDYIKKDIALYYGLPPNSIELVPNGIDTIKFSIKKNRMPNKEVRIISIGRLDDNKNHMLLLKAFSLALKQDPSPNISLVIVGDGPKRAELEDYIEKSGISRRVSMLGIRTDIPALLKNADIYVNTSLIEGLPLTILEAMASGLSIIATPAGGTVDIVKDGLNGTITSFDDRIVMTAIMELVNNRSLRNKMGSESRKIAESFDVQLMTKSYEVIYG